MFNGARSRAEMLKVRSCYGTEMTEASKAYECFEKEYYWLIL